ncbi:unnamed protein product [Caenorhabditis auriculariae]|uniref:G-patch domain-containing protein n=1 Tax=Caenorhabditis auriculariae TaxID=2777116 RepID=A0A8S1GS00_9PELO|nr:unnamed protein product [Caenorhabditis auriculariae]
MDVQQYQKKPTPIQDQIATDERGKTELSLAASQLVIGTRSDRNMVGSPKCSVLHEIIAEMILNNGRKIFMDAEDLGEFGIGARQIKRTAAFGESQSGKAKFAWERDSTSVSSIAQMLEAIVKPVNESIGSKMLRAMGWREGRGIGLANVTKARKRGGDTEEAEYERQQAKNIAPEYQLGQEDVIAHQLQPREGLHGLGYQGLRHSTALDEKFGRREAALKLNKKSKGIRGQAFGVGVFEEDDESVYTNYDLSEFDFSLDVGGKPQAIEDAKKIDATFKEQSKRLNPRKFYPPPKLPANFRPEHKVVPMDLKRLPTAIQKEAKNMTAIQRAKFLGEDRVSVLELVSDKDRKRLGKKSRWDVRGGEEDERSFDDERDRQQRNRIAYPDEPMKQARFKEYLLYVRRGLPYPQPTDMSVWEWESEKKDFEALLTHEERAMLPEVQSRSQPLARISLAAPIKELLHNKFVKESGGDLKVGKKDEDKLAAIKMGIFGDKTRSSFQWYPANGLAKNFNVPNPYPGENLVGVPQLQKFSTKRENLLNLGLPNTATELRARDEQRARDSSKIDRKVKEEDEEAGGEDEDENKENEEDTEKAPKSFFDIFGDSDEDDDEEEEKEKSEKPGPSTVPEVQIESEDEKEKETEILPEKKVMTVMDLPTSYGPSIPSSFEQNSIPAFSVLRYLQDDLKKRREEKKAKRKKREQRESEKKSKKFKKGKKDKKEKKNKKEKEKKKKSRKVTRKKEVQLSFFLVVIILLGF